MKNETKIMSKIQDLDELDELLFFEEVTFARGLLCTKFNSEQLLFEAFFDLIRIFSGIVP